MTSCHASKLLDQAITSMSIRDMWMYLYYLLTDLVINSVRVHLYPFICTVDTTEINVYQTPVHCAYYPYYDGITGGQKWE
jgi:hypothetical protein